MKYLESFKLAGPLEEDDYVLNFPYKLEMACYSDNVYPFKIFPQKRLGNVSFDDITIFYGGNGSGKSTLLNIIAQKLKLQRSALFNDAPNLEEYLNYCQYFLSPGRKISKASKIISSDDIFDFLLDVRAINSGIDKHREQVFEEYDKYRSSKEHFQMRSLDEYDELKKRNEARRETKSVFTARRIPTELSGKSNGESAFLYFTHEIGENALFLLDEPENSLSPKLQKELATFLTDSVRFYGCQLIISTHSPFILAMKDAKIYDLDSVPVRTKYWTELENVREYFDFFKSHENEF